MRILTKEIVNYENKEVELMGWVAVRRNHGKLIFIDLRDRSGLAQAVFLPSDKELHKKADTLRTEWVVKLKGKVGKRPKGMENPKIPNGEYEISATALEILSEAKTPPFDVLSDGYEVGEEVRMKYRYLDLRRGRLQKNLRERSRIIKYIRDFLSERDFTEVETPILTKSTPEGARDYLVPSRLYGGEFYALPQSPQQYKQLLMVAGLERYFQIARCFRDEDTRGDRQPEFTQLDLEMSFVEQKDVMELITEMLKNLVQSIYPEKKINKVSFAPMTYEIAMKKYGTDRPDLRENKNDLRELAFCWVVDFPFFEKIDNGKWTFTHNPFSSPKSEYIDDLLNKKNIGEILTTQYDIVLNGWEIGGGSIRSHKSEWLRAILNIIGYKNSREFEHIFEALDSGAPPHGGIALGLDRLIMILENEPNIREVIAFPKTGDGRDLMMDAPAEVEEKQLKELHVKVVR